MVSQQAHIKLIKRPAAQLAGRHPHDPEFIAKIGSTIIAVERAGVVIMDIPASFKLAEDDDIYICGTVEALNHFHDAYHADPALVPAPA